MAARACVLALCVAIGLVASSCGSSIPDRPNIILVLADDLGIGDVGAYNPDSRIETPHLDELAASGVRFTDASVPFSVCTPTRYGILTGQYAWRTRLQSEVLWPWSRPLIDDEIDTLPERLSAAGYDTALFGKWHLGWGWPTTDGEPPVGQGRQAQSRRSGENVDFEQAIGGGPTDHGFDHAFGVDAPNFPPYTFIEDGRATARPTQAKPRSQYGMNGPMAPGWSLEAVEPTINAALIRYLKDPARHQAPFFIYHPLTTPHTPIAPTQDWQGQSDAGPYGDLVMQMDHFVGSILTTLDEARLSSNTVVIFLSDNGGTGFSTNARGERDLSRRYRHETNMHYRGYKASIYEGGIRVPFIIHWPEELEARTITANVNAIGLYTSILSLAGLSPDTANPGTANDSYDFLSSVLAGGTPPDSTFILADFDGRMALRSGHDKLVAPKGTTRQTLGTAPVNMFALYDLRLDPTESEDISADNPETVRRLRQRLIDMTSD